MARRHALQDAKSGLGNPQCRWTQFCRAVHGELAYSAAIRINRLANELPYRSEAGDIWKTPREFSNGGGDCEDYAITKYFLLRRAGWSARDTALFVGFMKSQPSVAHAVTLFRHEKETYVLDNLDKNVVKFDVNAIRKPLYLINDESYIGFM